MHRRTKKLMFDSRTRQEILERDGGCMFCRLRYHMDGGSPFGCGIIDIMHYIPRSAGGLGIAENGVAGCRYHHALLDNGCRGLRPEMLRMMREHLQECCPEWDEKKLVYRKGWTDGVCRKDQRHRL